MAAKKLLYSYKPWWSSYLEAMPIVPIQVDAPMDELYGATTTTDRDRRIYVDSSFARNAPLEILSGSLERELQRQMRDVWNRFSWLTVDEWDSQVNICLELEINSSIRTENFGGNRQDASIFSREMALRWNVTDQPGLGDLGWHPNLIGLPEGLSAEEYYKLLNEPEEEEPPAEDDQQDGDPEETKESEQDDSDDEQESASESVGEDSSSSDDSEEDQDGDSSSSKSEESDSDVSDNDSSDTSDQDDSSGDQQLESGESGDSEDEDSESGTEDSSSEGDSSEGEGADDSDEPSGSEDENSNDSSDSEEGSEGESDSDSDGPAQSGDVGENSKPSTRQDKIDDLMNSSSAHSWQANDMKSPKESHDESWMPEEDQMAEGVSDLDKKEMDLELSQDIKGSFPIWSTARAYKDIRSWADEVLKAQPNHWEKLFTKVVSSGYQSSKIGGASDLSYSVRNPNQQKFGPILMGLHDYAPTVYIIQDVSYSMVTNKGLKASAEAFNTVSKKIMARYGDRVNWVAIDSEVKSVGKASAMTDSIIDKWSTGNFGGTDIGQLMIDLAAGKFKFKNKSYPKADMIILNSDCGFAWPWMDLDKAPNGLKFVVCSVLTRYRLFETRVKLPEWIKDDKEFIYVGDRNDQ